MNSKVKLSHKIDLRNAKAKQYKVGTIYEVRMMHSDYLDHLLKKITRGHSVLNLCSGTSDFGTKRVDIKWHENVTEIGDMFDLIDRTFVDNEYDFVYVDPPFEFYNPGPRNWKKLAKKGWIKETNPYYGHPFEWQFRCLDIARMALITRRQMMQINMEGAASDTDILMPVDSRPAATIVRIDWK